MKRILSILLTVCLLFSLLSCSKETKPDNTFSLGDGINIVTPQIESGEVEATSVSEAVLTQDEIEGLFSYSYLNKTEQSIYRKMLTMVRNLTVGFVNVGSFSTEYSSFVSKAFRALSNDFPEYYWMPSFYYLSVTEDKIAVAFKKNETEDSYGFTKEQIENNDMYFNDAILRIIEKTANAESDFQKEVIIHDALLSTVTYDSEYKAEGEPVSIYSAYGALVNGRAVCEGYARAFKLLCKYAGINCILITGDSKGVGHMWNMVQLDSNWYHVDTTWDDLGEEPLHTYLNVSEIKIRADHDIDINYNQVSASVSVQDATFNFFVPKAISDDYNYFVMKNYVISSDIIEDVSRVLIEAYNDGKNHGQLLFLSDEIKKDFKENYEKYVVDIQNRCIEKAGKLKFKLKTLSFPLSTCVIYFEKV